MWNSELDTHRDSLWMSFLEKDLWTGSRLGGFVRHHGMGRLAGDDRRQCFRGPWKVKGSEMGKLGRSSYFLYFRTKVQAAPPLKGGMWHYDEQMCDGEVGSDMCDVERGCRHDSGDRHERELRWTGGHVLAQ